MTKKLWSINGMATELGRDRRTIAKALRGTPRDGTTPSGNDGWFLQTALRRLPLTSNPTLSAAASSKPEGIVGLFADRARNWRELIKRGPYVATVTEVAQIFGVERGAVLTWLRAGLPYAKAGDWQTGEGFELYAHWVCDWIVLTGIASDAGCENLAAAELQIP